MKIVTQSYSVVGIDGKKLMSSLVVDYCTAEVEEEVVEEAAAEEEAVAAEGEGEDYRLLRVYAHAEVLTNTTM